MGVVVDSVCVKCVGQCSCTSDDSQLSSTNFDAIAETTDQPESISPPIAISSDESSDDSSTSPPKSTLVTSPTPQVYVPSIFSIDSGVLPERTKTKIREQLADLLQDENTTTIKPHHVARVWKQCLTKQTFEGAGSLEAGAKLILQGFLDDKLSEATMLKVVLAKYYFSEDSEFNTVGFSESLREILGDLEGRASVISEAMDEFLNGL